MHRMFNRNVHNEAATLALVFLRYINISKHKIIEQFLSFQLFHGGLTEAGIQRRGSCYQQPHSSSHLELDRKLLHTSATSSVYPTPN